jgi:hypothetical protein
MKKILLIAILILLLALFLSADVYMKNMERTKPFEMMGKKQDEKVEIKEQWLAKNKFAQFGKELSIIIDNDKGKLYFIVHRPKIYFEFPTTVNRERLLSLIQGLYPKAAEIIKSIQVTDVKVNLSGETKKIANWNCHSTEFEMVFMIPALNIMPKYKIKMWMTKDLPADYTKYTTVMDEFFLKYIVGMLNIDENSKKELKKLDTVDGFQVAAEVTVNIFGSEINIESQCLEVAEKPAPPGTYTVPSGYQKKLINPPIPSQNPSTF